MRSLFRTLLLVFVVLGGGLCRPDAVRAQAVDLTGIWRDDNGAEYRLRQIGQRLFWHSDGRPVSIHLFFGRIEGSTVTGEWVDLPGGQIVGNGSMTLRIETADRLVKMAQTERHGASVWTRMGASPTSPPQAGPGPAPAGPGTTTTAAAPPDTPTAPAGPAAAPPPPDAAAPWSATANSRPAAYGKPVAFSCPGGMGPDALISVWGTDIYTDDSRVCVAAVHAGLISAGAGGTVTIIFGPGQPAYTASSRNGVNSQAFPSWSRSFSFVRPDGTALAILPTPETASGLSPRAEYPNRQPGERYAYACPAGFALTTVWGTDVYTDDSPVCSAAVHAGLITSASGGMVIIEMRPGQSSYTGSPRNGVNSSNFGEWQFAYAFVGQAMPIPTTVTVGPDGAPVPGGGPLPPGLGGPPSSGGGPTGGGGPCTNPRTQQVMDEWLGRAVPTAEGVLRYEPWGRAVGQSASATITALPRPDTNLTRCEYLLERAPRLPSRNLGTLYDYLKDNGVI